MGRPGRVRSVPAIPVGCPDQDIAYAGVSQSHDDRRFSHWCGAELQEVVTNLAGLCAGLHDKTGIDPHGVVKLLGPVTDVGGMVVEPFGKRDSKFCEVDPMRGAQNGVV